MENNESKRRKEFCFLIAKFLQKLYPEIGQMFINECEKNHLFPSSIFLNSVSYDQLSTLMYPTISSNQLMDLLKSNSENYDQSFLRPLVLKKMPIKQIIKSFQPVKRIIGHTFIIYCLSIDKTSQILITGSDDSLVKVWKLPELALINSYVDHGNVITNVEIHPSNLFFASSSSDGIVCVFSLITGILKVKKKLPSEINDLHFSQCGKYISASTKKNGLYLWIFDDFLQNKPEYIKWYKSDSKDVWWVQFTPFSNFMFFVTQTNDIYCCHIPSKQIKLIFHSDNNIASLRMNHKLPLKIISAVERNSFFYVLMNSEKKDSFFTKIVKIDIGNGQNTIDVCWNCDESLIIALTKNSGIYAWNAESLTLTYHIDNSNYLRNSRRLSINPVMPYNVFVVNKDFLCSFWDLSIAPVKSYKVSSLTDQHISIDIDSSDDESDEEINDNQNDSSNSNIFQFNFMPTTNEQNCIEPISTYTIYFKIESISWSPNGEFIVCSDNLQGFTIFIRKTGKVNIQTEHQFLLKEKNKYENARIQFSRRLEIEASGQANANSNLQNQQLQQTNVNDQSAFLEIDDEQNILVDSESNPLVPQPRRWKLHQINLRVKKNEVPKDIIKYESSLENVFTK